MNTAFATTLLLPFAAGVLLLVVRWTPAGARRFALAMSVVTLLASLALGFEFFQRAVPTVDAAQPVSPRFEWRHTWLTFDRHDVSPFRLKQAELQFFLGLDSVSLALVVLTTLLTVSAVLISWEAITDRVREYYASLLILEAGLLGAFCAFDLVLFYVFFEFTLLPLFFLVGLWGGPQRRWAAVKFFLYTFAGSVVTLSGLLLLAVQMLVRGDVLHPFSIPEVAASLAGDALSPQMQIAIFLAMSVGFAIKVPLFPFHTWLPLAHVEAPTAGSVLLAGVLLKMGAYGFFRLCLPILPAACLRVGVPLIGLLSVIGIIYGALCAYAQTDMKKLVAYSSVSHLGFCMLGMFALNSEGLMGSVLQMINHGLSTGALFLLVGMVYDRYHTRMIGDLGGVASKLPLISVAMVFTCLASAGLPGLNGFVGEFLSLAGMFRRDRMFASISTLGVILAALYLLTMLQKAFFGPVGPAPAHAHGVRDLNGRELCSVAPLLVLCLVLGVYPQPLIDSLRPDVDRVAAVYSTAKPAAPRIASIDERGRP